ncbi:MAG TPA: oligosaccharide flippase family protein, partial [Candidatus Saccharimonadales bacterium]|nr:oligosaccharide flippase family protein [Candidatus Saccharimonadales bacterium]
MSSHSQKPLAYRLSQVNALARSTTAKNSFIVFGGNFLNSLLSFVAVIVVSRTLGPADFGILAIFNTILTMIVGITDGGLGTTAIKLISGYLANNNKKATATMRTIFKIEVSGGILIALTGLLFSPQIARLLGGEHLLLAVRLSFLASVFQSTAAFFGPFFVVYQQFTKNALVNCFGVAIRVAGILLLMATATLTLNNALWVY